MSIPRIASYYLYLVPYTVRTNTSSIISKIICTSGKKLKNEKTFDFNVVIKENIYVIEYVIRKIYIADQIKWCISGT